MNYFALCRNHNHLPSIASLQKSLIFWLCSKQHRSNNDIDIALYRWTNSPQNCLFLLYLSNFYPAPNNIYSRWQAVKHNSNIWRYSICKTANYAISPLWWWGVRIRITTVRKTVCCWSGWSNDCCPIKDVIHESISQGRVNFLSRS